ncbi:MAG: ATP-binding protein [Alistipes sp.]|jgi:AAA+ ATPase superfamily predicted ATPase|nr:ATP-binding protein [Alistipes sp.]
MRPNNPFLIAGYHSPAYFCDRVQETKTMTAALENGRNLTLIAPRRMGKTGLIKNVFYNLNAPKKSEVVTLYMDIYSTQSLNDFVKLFASTVLGALDSTPQKAMKRIGKFLRTLRPVLTLDEHTGNPKFTVDVSLSNDEVSLKELFAYIGSSERRVYIAIDEFQQIAEYPEKGVEALLRSHIQFLENANFVFAGSKQHMMHEMFFSAKRPFFQSTQTLTLDRIDRQEYFDFAAAFFKEEGFLLSPETFEYFYESFDGHTWYIQAILNRLYGYRKSPDNEMVDEAVNEIVAESAYTYENLLAAYTQGSVRLLKAIAREGCVKEITSGDFIARHTLKAASSVNSNLNKLLDRELAYKTPDGYIVYDRFMAIWLREQPY